MTIIITAFIGMAVVNVAVYGGLFLINVDLSRLMRTSAGRGPYMIKMIATLCLAILLNDVFWVLVFLSPRLLPNMDQATRLAILLGVAFIFRLGPGVVLFYLWRYIYRRT